MSDAPEIPVALYDLDGTLANYEEALRRDAAELLDRPDLLGSTEKVPKEARLEITRRPGWWSSLAPLARGFEVLGITQELGFRHMILSKGPRSHAAAWAEKLLWCDIRLPRDLGHGITLTDDKGLVYGRVLVEDWPPYIDRWLRWRPRGFVVLMDHHYNRGFEHPNVLRYDGSNKTELRECLAIAARRPEVNLARDFRQIAQDAFMVCAEMSTAAARHAGHFSAKMQELAELLEEQEKAEDGKAQATR